MGTLRAPHPRTEEMVYTFFSTIYRAFVKNDYILGYRANLNNFENCHLADNIFNLRCL